MSDVKVVLDHAGIRQVLTDDLRPVVDTAADQVAANVRAATSLPVIVDHYTTDRAAASIVIASPQGLAEQAKHGVITRAAAAAGLQVRPE